DIITPFPSPEVSVPQIPATTVLTPEPLSTPQVQEPAVQLGLPLHIPGLGLVSALVSVIKSRLSRTVLAVLGFCSIIIAVNVIVYAVYRYWWQKRVRNG
ncbi:MAG: hypothetical protein CVV33_06215, partial [Methanomicrobiales archaeon HGW-Methanomicrobiales-4]